MSQSLVCQGGTLSTGVNGEPVCSGTWELVNQSAMWGLSLTASEVAQLLGQVAALFALVWGFKLLIHVVLNKR